MRKTLELNEVLNVKTKIESPLDEIKAIEKLTKSILKMLARYTGLTVKEVVEILPKSAKTIERLKPNEVVDQVLAEHFLSLGKVVIEGNEIYSEPRTFAKWLKTPHNLLSGREPYEILRTVTGCNIVIDLLGRVKHGIYS